MSRSRKKTCVSGQKSWNLLIESEIFIFTKIKSFLFLIESEIFIFTKIKSFLFLIESEIFIFTKIKSFLFSRKSFEIIFSRKSFEIKIILIESNIFIFQKWKFSFWPKFCGWVFGVLTFTLVCTFNWIQNFHFHKNQKFSF